MATFARKKMCNDCPFRAKALPGWLGPWTIEQIEQMVRLDHDFICHTDIAAREVDGHTDAEIADEGQHCVGMIRYMNSHLKRSRCAEKRGWQDAVKTVPDQPIIPAPGFRKHHEKGPSAEFFQKLREEDEPAKPKRSRKKS